MEKQLEEHTHTKSGSERWCEKQYIEDVAVAANKKARHPNLIYLDRITRTLWEMNRILKENKMFD